MALFLYEHTRPHLKMGSNAKKPLQLVLIASGKCPGETEYANRLSRDILEFGDIINPGIGGVIAMLVELEN